MEYIPVTLVSVRMRHFRRCGVIAATLSDATVVTAPILMDTSFPRPTKIPKIFPCWQEENKLKLVPAFLADFRELSRIMDVDLPSFVEGSIGAADPLPVLPVSAGVHLS